MRRIQQQQRSSSRERGSSPIAAAIVFRLQEEGKDGSFNDADDESAGPKVTIHSSRGTFDTKEDGSASAYIINGPETNVAAGSGLRGIRWLRGP